MIVGTAADAVMQQLERAGYLAPQPPRGES
jgi:hypothetical protein